MSFLNSTIVQNIIEVTNPLYSKLLVAVVIIIMGFILGRILGKLLQKVLSEIELSKIIKTATGFNFKIELIFGTIVSYFIYFIFIMWALEKLGLSSMILNILSGGIIILIILAIILSIKDFVPNFIAGFYILLKGIIKEGDYIKLSNISGKIVEINLGETILKTKSGDTMVVPNSILMKEQLIKTKK